MDPQTQSLIGIVMNGVVGPSAMILGLILALRWMHRQLSASQRFNRKIISLMLKRSGATAEELRDLFREDTDIP